MSLGLRFRLSAMMFLQFFVWGIWLPILVLYLDSLHIRPGRVAFIMATYGLGSILGPFILGQLADRYFATQKVLAAAHLIGGGLLMAASTQRAFWPIFLLMFAYCNLYMPSIALANALTFRALGPEHQARFSGIRLLGTIGWVAAGFFFTAYWKHGREIAALQPFFNLVGTPSERHCLILAGLFSLIYGLYCFTLPHTPPIPAPEGALAEKPSAIRETLGLMRDRSFAVLVIDAALIGIMLAFYFQCEGPFLLDVGIVKEEVPRVMSFGQIGEMLVMLCIPLALAKLGYKGTMILGAGMWALRFGLSMIGQPQWLMVSTIVLHGFSFGFFFVVAQMYVDRAAPADIKASAQTFLIFLIYGLGCVTGTLLGGQAREYLGNDWPRIWAGPTMLTILCTLAFAALFREQRAPRPLVEPKPIPA